MPQIPIDTAPVMVSQTLTGAGLITNNGPGVLFLDDSSAVSAFSAGSSLLPFQTMNWTAGELWAVSDTSAVLSFMLGANTSVSPVTSITGPVNAIIDGDVNAVVTGGVSILNTPKVQVTNSVAVTGNVTADISGPVNANITGPVTVEGDVDVAGIVTANNGIDFLGRVHYNNGWVTPALQEFDVSKYASIMVICRSLGGTLTRVGITVDPEWSLGGEWIATGDTFRWNAGYLTGTPGGSQSVFDVKAGRMRLNITASFAGASIMLYVLGSSQKLTERYSNAGTTRYERVDLTSTTGFTWKTIPSTWPATIEFMCNRAIPTGMDIGIATAALPEPPLGFLLWYGQGPLPARTRLGSVICPREPLMLWMRSTTGDGLSYAFTFSG